jgi:hypothetical protein
MERCQFSTGGLAQMDPTTDIVLAVLLALIFAIVVHHWSVIWNAIRPSAADEASILPPLGPKTTERTPSKRRKPQRSNKRRRKPDTIEAHL